MRPRTSDACSAAQLADAALRRRGKMRQVDIPLAEGEVTDASALAIQAVLKAAVPALAVGGQSDVRDAWTAYPARVAAERANIMPELSGRAVRVSNLGARRRPPRRPSNGCAAWPSSRNIPRAADRDGVALETPVHPARLRRLARCS